MNHNIFLVFYLQLKNKLPFSVTFFYSYAIFIVLIVCIAIPKNVYSETILDSNNVALFDWTDTTTGHIGTDENGANYNKIPSYNWGIGNRSNDELFKVLPYNKKIPNSTGPNGEQYGIELEFGNDSIPPRSPGTKLLKHFVDCGQPFFQTNKLDRSEVHIQSTLQDMGVKEGSTFWLGWSEYYTNIDTDRVTTLLQFRNQPSRKLLQTQGIDTSLDSVLTKVSTGGPVIAIELIPTEFGASYHFQVREGSPDNWTISNENKHTMESPLVLNTWYDFIVQIKYSQKNDGLFRIWHSTPNKPMTLENPEWSYIGSTMYQYPTIQSINVLPSPALRWGLYRYNCKTNNIQNSCKILTHDNRYMTKYLGPVRFWKGSSDNGFALVHPK